MGTAGGQKRPVTGQNLWAIVAVVLVAALVVGCATRRSVATGGLQQANAIVPWLDKSAAVPTGPYTPLPVAPPQTSAPACTNDHLSLGEVSPVQTTQNDGVLVTLRNTGPSACLLAGTPKVAADAAGEPEIVATTEAMPFYGEEADTPPDGTVTVEIDVPAACSADPGGSTQGLPTYSRLVIDLPGGGTTAVDGKGFQFPCGMANTPFFTYRPAPIYPSDPLSSLVPQLRLPSSVDRSSTLVYDVTLSNPDQQPVSLSPCPVYIEYSSIATKATYQLNCNQERSIPPHGQVEYQMQMPIPATATPGQARLWWSLVGPSMHMASGPIEIR